MALTACPQPVIPGLSAGTRGVSASAAVAPPPRVSAADHDRVADLVGKGNINPVLLSTWLLPGVAPAALLPAAARVELVLKSCL